MARIRVLSALTAVAVLGTTALMGAPALAASPHHHGGVQHVRSLITQELPRIRGGSPHTSDSLRIVRSASKGQPDVSIAFAGSRGSVGTTDTNGVAVSLNVASGTDGATVTGPDGFAKVAVLEDSRAADDVRFTIDAPGLRLVPEGRGGVAFFNEASQEVGKILPPWATDANGRALKTSFILRGHTLIQHVDTDGAAFPVIADPKFTWGIISGTVYFNKDETWLIAEDVDYLTDLTDFAPPPFNFVLGIHIYAIQGMAIYADAVDECVKVKSYGAIGVYSGGYCTW